ncbi:MAG: MaoC family dehydratase N-terminal domain-containing protein [Candidatus Rokubacteria bacterium]|nr:MaoC family dehydratase N-terminal domain-containing protein [Candidatus Rokubacteria bacterium]
MLLEHGRGEASGPAVEITQERIGRYAEITEDWNPLHVDQAFARTTSFGGVIAHGMLSLNLAWELLREIHGDEGIEDVELTVRFKKPVRPGDTVRARARREADAAGGWEVWIENQAGDAVIAGHARPAP